MDFLEDIITPTSSRPHLLTVAARRPRRPSRGATGQAVSGIVKRSRSIQIDQDQLPGKQITPFFCIYSCRISKSFP